MHCKRKKSCIARERTHASRKEIHTSREKDLPITRRSTSTALFSLQKWHQENYQHITSAYFIALTSKEEYIEDYMANIRHKLYLFHVKPDRVDVECSRRTIKCQHGKRHCLPFELHFYANEFYLSLCREHKKWLILKTNHRYGRHQKGCSTTWNFFLAANWDIVQRGVPNS